MSTTDDISVTHKSMPEHLIIYLNRFLTCCSPQIQTNLTFNQTISFPCYLTKERISWICVNSCNRNFLEGLFNMFTIRKLDLTCLPNNILYYICFCLLQSWFVPHKLLISLVSERFGGRGVISTYKPASGIFNSSIHRHTTITSVFVSQWSSVLSPGLR